MIFISYSSAQRELAMSLQAELALREREAWLDIGKFPIGEEFVNQIAGGLKAATAVVNIDTVEGRASYWVNREVQVAERLRRHGLVTHLLRLSPGGNQSSLVEFDRSFLSVDETVAFIEQSVPKGHARTSADGNQVTLTEFLRREAPRNWYGFADVLAELDAWQDGARRGCWISGAAGSGKSALTRVWLAANQLLGYRDDRVLQIMFWSLGRHYGHVSKSAVISEMANGSESSRGGQTLVCLDGLDEVEWSHQDVVEVCLAAFFAEQKLLVTSRKVPAFLPEEFLHLKLRPLGDEELGLYLRGLSLDPALKREFIANGLDSELFAERMLEEVKAGKMPVHELARLRNELKAGRVSIHDLDRLLSERRLTQR